jgi:hypothetical protein
MASSRVSVVRMGFGSLSRTTFQPLPAGMTWRSALSGTGASFASTLCIIRATVIDRDGRAGVPERGDGAALVEEIRSRKDIG